MKKEKKKAVVAFSGGVDSSVSAFLLKKRGFDVTAVFMKLFESDSEKKAGKVAESMDIPFKIVDLRKEFGKRIIDCFVDGYRRGLTPNPCVICNREIKFGLFLKEAEKMDADLFATGHYARIVKKGGIFRLFKAGDAKKDQSYFLYRLSQKQLSKAFFPLSFYSKEEVRKIAKKNKIPSFNFQESQEVCFADAGFLKEKLGEKKGKIVDKKGNVLGEHNGLWFYTFGQRKRIGLAGGPYFVTGKNLKKNELVVSKDGKDLLSKEVKFKSVNWISGRDPSVPAAFRAKIRYGHGAAPGILKKGRFVFNKPQRAITPGQSIVFYKGSEVLGGGIII